MRFDDKVIVIPGATSGLGKDAAKRFAAAGASVAFSGRRAEQGAEVLQEIEAAGGTAIYVQGDISVEEDIVALIEGAVERFGGLDFAYNVAGVTGEAYSRVADYTVEGFRECIAINLTGTFMSMKYCIPHMLKRGGGAIVNMSSVAGLHATPGGAGYVSSKHALVGLTKAAALDYIQDNIRVNAVAPGVVHTEMLDWGMKENPELTDAAIAHQPIGRLGQMMEITQAAMWLCSDESSFITGVTLPVDGGYLMA